MCTRCLFRDRVFNVFSLHSDKHNKCATSTTPFLLVVVLRLRGGRRWTLPALTVFVTVSSYSPGRGTSLAWTLVS